MNDQTRLGPTLLESLWRYRLAMVVVPLLLGIVAFLVVSQQAPVYEVPARLFLSDPTTTPGLSSGGFNPGINPDEYVPQQAARAGSRVVFDTALTLLDEELSLGELQSEIVIESNPGDLSLVFYATGPTGESAAARANAIARAFRTLNEDSERDSAGRAVAEIGVQIDDLETQLRQLDDRLESDPTNLGLQSQIQNLSSRIIELESTVTQVKVDGELRGDGVALYEPAIPPSSPARPQPAQSAALVGFLAAVATGMWAYWYAGKSQRVLTRTDPEAVLGVPLLGEIPLYRMTAEDQLTALLRVDPAAAEAYEFVLSSIEFALADLGGKSIMITSTLPGDGKTTTTLQLAVAASRDRRRVVLVDADIRARGLTTVLGSEDRVGLSDLAALDLEPKDVIRRYRFSEQSQIPVVTAGQRRGDPAALLRTNTFRRAMASITESAELLIIDSSPLLAVADAVIVAGSADGMVLVVSSGTPVSELVKVKERLKFVSTPLLGYVFNRSEATTAAAYGYGYGVSEDDDGEQRLLPLGIKPRSITAEKAEKEPATRRPRATLPAGDRTE